MAQVLHMETGFPGKSNPMSSSVFQSKDQDLPYSVETPYGYRLDLDFLKYVDDIEKGNTLKKVHVHRRPRYSSLPRGYGYTGSWWTSTESLCSNASVESRQSSYSYCGRSFYPQYPMENKPPLFPGGFNARVEKTLLDAKKKLEEDNFDSVDGQRPRIGSLGSLQGSISGSASSLVGAGLNQSFSKSAPSISQSGGCSQFTPMNSGLSTPVSPSPAHLQYVREQMAVALKRLKQLEEQVKMIPVLQVKISVLQEEKRQLSVQLKSQKFLGHMSGFGKSRSRGELYIDIPEEETDQNNDVFSPCSPRQDSGCETEESTLSKRVSQTPKKETRSVSVGTDESAKECESEVNKTSAALKTVVECKSVGVLVKEHDLGLPSTVTQDEKEQQCRTIESLCSKISVLEMQLKKALQELQLAQQKLEEQKPKQTSEKGQEVKPTTADAISMTTVGWKELQGEHNKEVSDVGLQTVRPSEQVVQRTVGVQAYTSLQPTGDVEQDSKQPVTQDQLKISHRVKELEYREAGSSGSKDISLSVHTQLPSEHGKVEVSPPQVTVYETLVASASTVPYTIYKSSESLERAFPVQSNPSTGNQHIVKKISIKTDTWGEEVKDSKTLPVQAVVTELKSTAAQEGEDGTSATSNNSLQFVEVNGGYNAISSESSSDDSSSDNESSASEYHEASEAPMEGQFHKAESRPTQAEEQGSSSGRERLTDVSTTTRTDSASSQWILKHRFTLSDSLVSASVALQKHLENPDSKDMKAAYSAVLQEWLRVSCHKGADAEVVQQHMMVFRAMSPKLLEFIINMGDGNGNTALHYTVSHSNFPVVKLLLDTGMCSVDKPNKAGYTAIMLTALAAVRSESDMDTVMQLLRLGDVNAKATQAGQTTLMLAVSHGRLDMVKALLVCGADINLQDEDGSTALMCACEHGHMEIVKALLAEKNCNVALTDNDGSTALSIALEAGQKAIASLLQSHLNCNNSSYPVRFSLYLYISTYLAFEQFPCYES
ncbi:KN motif and ankyrin repeat domain-containing protein 2 [Protopterus annectens]|uniref:KN motif and ankyrin repeat domain-containing protein 2 n=1 Tax=Protopterus annectens TaxID=7888 RepID=UPI001CFC3C6B|nr:KN motif and ankyrin repeat domain-containing protein 2 [Protopterus annectens]